jgi:hypothetical protein
VSDQVCATTHHNILLAESHLDIHYIEGFSHIVISMTAPITSGWSDFAGWVLIYWESATFARRTPKAEVVFLPFGV